MNSKIKRYIAASCLLLLIITVFTACKGGDNGETGSTVDPFSVTEYPATVTTTAPTVTTDESSTGMFDDFATTTTPASTTQRSTTNSSVSIPVVPIPGITDPSVPQTLPPSVDPQLTNTTNGGSQYDIKKLLSAFGYAYDPDEDCFYSELDSWQRRGGFAPHYDLGAFLLNMQYITFTVDLAGAAKAGDFSSGKVTTALSLTERKSAFTRNLLTQTPSFTTRLTTSIF